MQTMAMCMLRVPQIRGGLYGPSYWALDDMSNCQISHYLGSSHLSDSVFHASGRTTAHKPPELGACCWMQTSRLGERWGETVVLWEPSKSASSDHKVCTALTATVFFTVIRTVLVTWETIRSHFHSFNYEFQSHAFVVLTWRIWPRASLQLL